MKIKIFPFSSFLLLMVANQSWADSGARLGECGANLALLSQVAWGDLTMRRTVEREDQVVRRVATAAERRSAEKVGKAYYAGLPPEKKAEMKEKKIRYLAVEIPKPKRSVEAPTEGKPEGTPPQSNAGKQSDVASNVDVMIYDTLGGATVNKYVYTVNTAPSAGSTLKLAEYDTLYVGR